GIGFGLIEIRMSVDEQEPIAPATAHRERGSQQNRAVAAEHDGKFIAIEQFSDGFRQLERVLRDPAGVERFRLGVEPSAIGCVRLHASRAPRPRAFGETVREQSVRETLDTGRFEPKVRRRFQDRAAPGNDSRIHRHRFRTSRSSSCNAWADERLGPAEPRCRVRHAGHTDRLEKYTAVRVESYPLVTSARLISASSLRMLSATKLQRW